MLPSPMVQARDINGRPPMATTKPSAVPQPQAAAKAGSSQAQAGVTQPALMRPGDLALSHSDKAQDPTAAAGASKARMAVAGGKQQGARGDSAASAAPAPAGTSAHAQMARIRAEAEQQALSEVSLFHARLAF